MQMTGFALGAIAALIASSAHAKMVEVRETGPPMILVAEISPEAIHAALRSLTERHEMNIRVPDVLAIDAHTEAIDLSELILADLHEYASRWFVQQVIIAKPYGGITSAFGINKSVDGSVLIVDGGSAIFKIGRYTERIGGGASGGFPPIRASPPNTG